MFLNICCLGPKLNKQTIRLMTDYDLKQKSNIPSCFITLKLSDRHWQLTESQKNPLQSSWFQKIFLIAIVFVRNCFSKIMMGVRDFMSDTVKRLWLLLYQHLKHTGRTGNHFEITWVIRQKGESQNVWISWGKKCLFFGKFCVLFFLETPVLSFVLLPYYWR